MTVIFSKKFQSENPKIRSAAKTAYHTKTHKNGVWNRSASSSGVKIVLVLFLSIIGLFSAANHHLWFVKDDTTKLVATFEFAFDRIQQELYDQATTTIISQKKKRKFRNVNDSEKEESLFMFGLGNNNGDNDDDKTTIMEAIMKKQGISRFMGVDSDATRLTQARDVGKDYFRFFFADMKVMESANGVVPSPPKNEYNYQIAPLVMETKAFDSYLINPTKISSHDDSYRRVACVCMAFLHAMKYHDTKKDGIIHHPVAMVALLGEHKVDAKLLDLMDLVRYELDGMMMQECRLKEGTTEHDLYQLWVTQSESMKGVNVEKEEKDELRQHHNGKKQLSGFDLIQNRMYQMVTMPVTMPRNDFADVATHWEKGDGGLLDGDRLILGKLYKSANSVFESGLGESTRIAALSGVPRYSGVDSDPHWVSMARNNVKQTELILENGMNRTSIPNNNMDHYFRFQFADIGPTKLWGYPQNDRLSKIPYDYQIAPLVPEGDAFDVYLIDGRYRIACACVAFLHALKHVANHHRTNVRVGIHDNGSILWMTRGYSAMKQLAHVVEKGPRLWVYALKDTTTEEDLYKVWKAHVHDVR